MAPDQKRLLTAHTSKLGKTDIVSLLRNESAWTTLSLSTRTELYALLPSSGPNEPPHDPDVHPLQSSCKPYIAEELRRWQEDLKDGREAKKWRLEAMRAGRERKEGGFDEWIEKEREEYWGVKVGERGRGKGREEELRHDGSGANGVGKEEQAENVDGGKVEDDYALPVVAQSPDSSGGLKSAKEGDGE